MIFNFDDLIMKKKNGIEKTQGVFEMNFFKKII